MLASLCVDQCFRLWNLLLISRFTWLSLHHKVVLSIFWLLRYINVNHNLTAVWLDSTCKKVFQSALGIILSHTNVPFMCLDRQQSVFRIQLTCIYFNSKLLLLPLLCCAHELLEMAPALGVKPWVNVCLFVFSL